MTRRSSNGKGGASASPAVPTSDEVAKADQWEAEALAAIDAVQDPVEAEKLLRKVTAVEQAMRLTEVAGDRERRWRGTKLKAEARYGELLPKKSQGKRNLSQPAKGDKDAEARARKVAKAKQDDPEAFTDYIENEPQPTRAGLLRKTKSDEPKRAKVTNGKRKPKDALTVEGGSGAPYDPDVISWVRARTRAGWTTGRIVSASKSGTDGWPGGDGGLTDGGLTACRVAIYHLEQYEKLNPRRRRPKYSGKRMREIAAARKWPNYPPLIDVQYRVMQLTTLLDTTVIEDYSFDDIYVVQDLHDDLLELQGWIDHVVAACWEKMDRADVLERIRKLRDTTGRTDAEAEAFKAKADKLEAKFERDLLGSSS